MANNSKEPKSPSAPEWLRKLQVDFEREILADSGNVAYKASSDSSILSDANLFHMLGIFLFNIFFYFSMTSNEC